MSDKDTQDFNDLETPEDLDAEEQVEEEVEEEEDNESPDGDSTADDDEEEEQDDSDTEEWESEADYLKAKGIEDAESLDEVLERYTQERGTYKSKAQQMEQLDTLLKAKGFANGIDDLITGQVFNQPQAPSKQPEQQEQYFSDNPFSEAFKEFEENISDENTKKFYKSFNKFADKAVGSQLKKVADMYAPVIQTIMDLQKEMYNMRWATFQSPGKDLVTKEKFLSAMEHYGIDDPEKVMQLLAINDPKLLEKIQQKGVEKGKKKFRKFKKKGMPRGKQTERSTGWKQYYTPDGHPDESKLGKLSLDEQIKILEQAERATKPR